MKFRPSILTVPSLALFLTACNGGGGVVVDTGPVGVGLAAIGVSIVVAAWVGALFGKGGDK
jgi:hypothetical protein